VTIGNKGVDRVTDSVYSKGMDKPTVTPSTDCPVCGETYTGPCRKCDRYGLHDGSCDHKPADGYTPPVRVGGSEWYR